MHSQNIVPCLIIISAFFSTLLLSNSILGSYALLPLIIMILTACYVFQNKTPGFRATKGRYVLLQWIVSLAFVLILVYIDLYCRITFPEKSQQWLHDNMLLLVLCTLSVIAVVGLCLLETILDLFVYPAPPSSTSTSEEAVQSTNHRSKIIWFVVEVLVVLFIILYIINSHQAQVVGSGSGQQQASVKTN